MEPSSPTPSPSKASFSLLALALGAALAPAARADWLLYADGRRVEAAAPRQGGDGLWTVELEGRRVALKPGEAVAVIDAGGAETDVTTPLRDAPASAEDLAAVEVLAGRDGEAAAAAWLSLMDRRTRGVLEALVPLTTHRASAVRERALTALVRLRSRESTAAAARAVLAEKEREVRKAAGSALFAVQELFRRADLAAETHAGLAHEDGELRVTFALLAPTTLEAAVPVLVEDGLGHRDHHTRESAALALGLRGNPAGEKVLLKVLSRTALEVSDDPALNERLLIAEHVAVCAALGRLTTPTSRTALEKALRSPHEAVRTAAQAALTSRGGT